MQLTVISIAVCEVESVQNVVSDENWPQDSFSLSGNEDTFPLDTVLFIRVLCFSLVSFPDWQLLLEHYILYIPCIIQEGSAMIDFKKAKRGVVQGLARG